MQCPYAFNTLKRNHSINMSMFLAWYSSFFMYRKKKNSLWKLCTLPFYSEIKHKIDLFYHSKSWIATGIMRVLYSTYNFLNKMFFQFFFIYVLTASWNPLPPVQQFLRGASQVPGNSDNHHLVHLGGPSPALAGVAVTLSADSSSLEDTIDSGDLSSTFLSDLPAAE